jgi:histidyl-tRNA synthetase
VEQIEQFLQIRSAGRAEVIRQLHANFGSVPGAGQEMAVLERMSHYLDIAGYHDDRVVIDLTIARGLAYYNGPVFETILLDAPQFGSVFSGGRYDDLVMRFLGERVPATGASMGVDRLLAALRFLDKVSLRKSTAKVLVNCSPRSGFNVARLFRQTHLPEDFLEARLGTNRVEARVREEPGVDGPFSRGFFEPL